MKALDLIFAARPMLHLPVWSIFLITHEYIYPNQKPGRESLIILAALSINIAGTYYLNQIYDYESDLINKKLGFLQSGKITRREMFIAYFMSLAISTAAAFAVNVETGLVFLLISVLGHLYSCPPMRLKDRPFWGLFSNSIAYGLMIPLTFPDFPQLLKGKGVYLPVYFFLAVSAAYLLTIIPDREGDIKSGKITFAAILPVFYVMLIAMLMLYLSLMSALRMDHYLLAVISAVSIVLFLIAMVHRKSQIILAACKTPILLTSLLAGYYYPEYLIFLLAIVILTRLYYYKRFGITYPKLN